MSVVEKLTAAEVPFSSTVGKSVMFTAPGGAVVAQIAIMVPSVEHDYRETAEAVAARIIATWNGHDHRSFPDAADGRPMPPMGDELMIAGLNGEDARFVAIQLAQNGLTLVPAAPPASLTGEGE